MTRTIVFRNANVTKSDINDIVKAYQELKLNAHAFTHLKLVPEKNLVINDIDLLLVNCLMLIKDEFSELEILLEFPNNDITTNAGKRLVGKLTQSAVYAYLMTGKTVYAMKTGDVIHHQLDFSGLQQFGTDTFSLSESFMLYLFITRKNDALYDLLFINNTHQVGKQLQSLVKKVTWNKSVDRLQTLLNAEIIKSATPLNIKDAILGLGQMAFINCLAQANILAVFTNRDYIKDNMDELIELRVSALSSENKSGVRIYNNYEYYKQVESVFLELESKPLVYHFVFSALASKLLPRRLSHGNMPAFVKNVFNLWKFCKDLVHGMMELAKNIRDHSSTKTGVISANIIRKPLLGNDGIFDAETADNSESGDGEVFLNLHILDFGTLGIIPKIAANTGAMIDSPEIDEDIKSLLEVDRTRIENGGFSLQDFFSDESELLNQQAKRSIAHFGLLILKELIASNNGLLIVSSADINGDVEIARDVSGFPWENAGNIKREPLACGTHFDIIMPVNLNKAYKPHLPHKQQMITEPELQSIENLLEFDIIDITSPGSVIREATTKTIFSFRFPQIIMNDKNAEARLKQEYKTAISRIPKDLSGAVIMHLNFENLEGLDATELFRFLGFIESKSAAHNIIISHLENEIFEDLIKLNKAYFKIMPEMGFWNTAKPAVFLSYETEPDTGNRFYFTDVLWGPNPALFAKLNKMVSFTQYNSVSLMQKEIYSDQGINIEDAAVPKLDTPLFINDNILLPIDLLIKHKDKKSIFENNAALLLSIDLL